MKNGLSKEGREEREYVIISPESVFILKKWCSASIWYKLSR